MPRVLGAPRCKLAEFAGCSSLHQNGLSQRMLTTLNESSLSAHRITAHRDIRYYTASARLSVDTVSANRDLTNLSGFPDCEIFS